MKQIQALKSYPKKIWHPANSVSLCFHMDRDKVDWYQRTEYGLRRGCQKKENKNRQDLVERKRRNRSEGMTITLSVVFTTWDVLSIENELSELILFSICCDTCLIWEIECSIAVNWDESDDTVEWKKDKMRWISKKRISGFFTFGFWNRLQWFL